MKASARQLGRRRERAAFFGLRVVRRPGPRLTSREGAGEVQTPLAGPGADRLRIEDLVWFRHAKSGEPAEHVHLVSGEAVVDVGPTYRGTGNAR